MAYHNLLSKCDRALVAFIVSEGAGTNADTFPAKRSLGRDLPHTICWSESAVETARLSGTYTVKVSILVRSLATPGEGESDSKPRVDADARTAAVFDAFHTRLDTAGDKLGSAITVAARAVALSDPATFGDLAEFTVLDVMIKGIEASFEEGTDSWVDTLNLELVACPGAVE